MDRRTFLLGSAALIGSSLAVTAEAMAQGAAYPTQSIKVIVPYAAGGAVDATMRMLEPKLRELLGQPVVIENKPGANGIVGASQVARAAADGYTLMFAPREVFSVNPILQDKPAYDGLKDFAHIGIATEAPYVLIVNPGLGVKTLDALVDKAKAESLNYASFGHGSMAQLNIEAFAQHFGIKLVHVPYRGSAPAVQAVVTGEVALSISTLPPALGFIQEGKVLALAAGAERRLDKLPDVPTFTELKQPADLFVPASFAMAAPAQTPSDVVQRLSAALSTALADPQTSGRIVTAGLTPASSTPEKMMDMIRSDTSRFGELIKRTGIKAE